ncbi:MAG: ABC transporter substrate-binding protein [Alphaproteobacteria bacterium]|nr:ABC transporter substrate-binding protein [Alphaproteobacteria bacterium]
MKKLLLSLCMALALTACKDEQKASPQADKRPVVKIGVMLPLSGEMAEFGQNSLYAVEFAKEDHKNSPIKFDIVFEDDTFTPSRAAVIANKLISVDKVDAIVTSFSPVGSAVSPIADKAKVLHIGLSNAANIAEGELNFTNWQELDIAAKKLVDYLVSQNVKKVASFNMETVGNEEMRVKTNQFLDENGIEYEDFYFNPENRDFAMMVQKAVAFGADYWILNSFSPGQDILRKEMIEHKIDIPVVNIQCMKLSKNPQLFENQVFVDAPDGSKDFRERMSQKTTSKVLNIPAYAYDIVNLIMLANEDFYAKNGRVPNDYELADTLKKTKYYQGVVGELEVQNNGVIKSPSVVKKIINGQPVEIEE